jgi:type I restriction enzyme R subunit
VARKLTEFLQATDRFDKTIVFCEDVDHAERMRQELVNANPDLAADNRKYVMRITGDNPEGKAELDNFIDPESRYPVIATTSRLMNTGVDAQTCKVIVLDQQIQAMTVFKQIIGRGTRINEDYGKLYFTILDFRKATELFADPDFDGDPVQIYEPGPDDTPVPPVDGFEPEPPAGPDGSPEPPPLPPDGPDLPPEGRGRVKYVVGDVPVWVVSERVQYYGKDGKLITESLKDYTRAAVQQEYASLDDFLRRWSSAEKKGAVIAELEEQGVLFEALSDEVGKELDAFDLVCHVAFGQPPLTRRERAENVKKRDVFTKYGEQAREVLGALLDKYADEGIRNIEDLGVLRIQPFDRFGTPVEIVKRFGGKSRYLDALRDLEGAVYGTATG